MFPYLAFFLAMTVPVHASQNRFRATTEHLVAGFVEVTETCVDKRQEIVIHFENAKRPIFDDWVGVYPKGYDASDEPQHWVRIVITV
jgi:hypothetical protein